MFIKHTAMQNTINDLQWLQLSAAIYWRFADRAASQFIYLSN